MLSMLWTGTVPVLRVFSIAAVLQAGTFGALHYYGIPSGMVGVFLTFVYGLIMAIVCLMEGSLQVAVLLHGLADLVIFAMVC